MATYQTGEELDEELKKKGYSNKQQRDEIIVAQGLQPVTVSYSGNLIRNALGQGLALGFGDEIEAGIRSLGSDRSYNEIRDELRGDIEAWQTENPKMALASELGGGLLTGVLGGAKVLGAKALQHGAKTMGKMALLGGAEGAASGYGHSIRDDIAGNAQDAALGGLLGGAVGGAMYPATRAVQGIVNRGPTGAAERSVRTSLQDAGIDSAAAAKKVMLDEAGPNAIIGDIPGTMGRFRPAAQAPGPGKLKMQEAMSARQSGVSDEMDALAAKMTGKNETPIEMKGRLRSQKSAEAKTNYAPVMAQEVNPTEAVVGTTKTVAGRKAARDARDEYSMMFPDRPPIDLNDLDNQTDLEFWNLMQSHLFGQSKKLKGSNVAPGNVRRASLVDKTRNIITSEFDDQVPGYKDARTAFRKVTAESDALDVGMEVMRPGSKLMPKDVENLVKKMDEGEKRGFLKGVVTHAQKKFLTSPDTANTALNMLRRPGTRKNIVAAFDGDAKKADEFINTLRQMGRRGETASDLLANSNTAEKLAEQAQVNAGGVIDAADSLIRGEVAQGGRQAMSSLRGFFGGGNTPAINSQITNAFLGSGTIADDILRNAFRGGQISPTLPSAAIGVGSSSGLGANYGMYD